jgi:hypothetical protein
MSDETQPDCERVQIDCIEVLVPCADGMVVDLASGTSYRRRALVTRDGRLLDLFPPDAESDSA